MFFRQRGNQLLIAALEGQDDLPETITIEGRAQDPTLITVTDGADWQYPRSLNAPLESEQLQFSNGGLVEDVDAGQGAIFHLTIHILAGVRQRLTLVFDAVEAYWAYHITDKKQDRVLEIIDTQDQIWFESQPRETPSAPQVFRSTQALPLSVRPQQAFALRSEGVFGPKTLVSSLPAPTANGDLPSLIPQDGALVAHIYINI